MNIRSYHIGIVFLYQYIRIFICKKLYTPEPLGPPGEEENPGEKTAALDAMFDPTTEPHPFFWKYISACRRIQYQCVEWETLWHHTTEPHPWFAITLKDCKFTLVWHCMESAEVYVGNIPRHNMSSLSAQFLFILLSLKARLTGCSARVRNAQECDAISTEVCNLLEVKRGKIWGKSAPVGRA